jgi:hypothetical protein
VIIDSFEWKSTDFHTLRVFPISPQNALSYVLITHLSAAEGVGGRSLIC